MSILKNSWKVAVGAMAAVGLLAGGAWANCLYNGEPASCQWGNSCWTVNNLYPPNEGKDCDDLVAACIKDGALFTNATVQGEGVPCDGTPEGGYVMGTVIGCCFWAGSGDYGVVDSIKANDCKTGTNKYWEGVTACDNANPPEGDPTWPEVEAVVLGYCKWDTETQCWPITTADDDYEKQVEYCQSGDNIWWASPKAPPAGSTPGTCPTSTPDFPLEGAPVACKNSSGQQLYCQWDDGCFAIDERYATGADSGKSCAELIEKCNKDGALYAGVNGIDSTNNYGEGIDCEVNGGQIVSVLARVTGKSNRYERLVSVNHRTLTVDSKTDSKVSVRVINMKGKTVAKYNLKSGASVNLRKVPAGSYIVEARRAKDGVKGSAKITLK